MRNLTAQTNKEIGKARHFAELLQFSRDDFERIERLLRSEMNEMKGVKYRKNNSDRSISLEFVKQELDVQKETRSNPMDLFEVLKFELALETVAAKQKGTQAIHHAFGQGQLDEGARDAALQAVEDMY